MSRRPRQFLPPYLRNAIAKYGVVWARLHYGRVFHAKLEDSAEASICGATPGGYRGYGRWKHATRGRPNSGSICKNCNELIEQAQEPVTV